MERLFWRKKLLLILTAVFVILGAIVMDSLGISSSSAYAASVDKSHVKTLVIKIEDELLSRKQIVSGKDERIEFKFKGYTEKELIQAVCIVEETDHLYSYGRRLLYGTWYDKSAKSKFAQVVMTNYEYYNSAGKLITCNPRTRTQKLEEAIEEATSWINPSMSRTRKIQVIHDYICRHGKYNSKRDYAFNAYDILVTGQGYCAAYSDAFKLLCDEIGIECICVNSEDLNHAWNMVKVGSKWYNVDCTYDDTSNIDKSYYAKISHKYFLKSNAYMKKNNHKSSDWKAGIACRYANGTTYYSWNMINTGGARTMVSSAKSCETSLKKYSYPNYGKANGGTIKVNPCIDSCNRDVTYGGTAIVSGGKLKASHSFYMKDQIYFHNTSSKISAKYSKAYVPSGAKNYISVSSSGKMTVKAGLKSGKYKIKVRATTATTNTYRSQKKNFYVNIRVK